MTDKELINDEIERRINNLWHLLPEGERVLQDNFTKDDANNLGKYTELESLLRFIDSLPEESKCIYNRTLDERKKFCKYCSAACDVRIEEEHTSEDLEEEIKNYIQKEYPDGMGFQNVPKIARHFAEWQKQRDQETIELAEDHAMLAGMNRMKEEMMKDAVIAWVNTYESVTNPYDNEVSFITNLSPSKFKNKETVKIIIVKED